MASPLVSVLMPVYNGQRFLQPALDSLFGQTYQEFELIAVDDGSTDDTPKILAGTSDPRLKIVRIAHAGLVAALNEGIAHCTADYIARMDADDISYPDRLARQVEYLESHADADLVTCWSDLLDDGSEVVGRMLGGVREDMILELAGGNDVVHGSILVRRRALPAQPVYSAPPEDYWLWVRMARNGKSFHCIPQAMYGFREHTQRYSLLRAQTQSRGIVEVQWPLLQECSRTRDPADDAVRSRIALGWGRVGGAAYRCGRPDRGIEAYRRFREWARGQRSGRLDAAILSGAESLIWGGCPFWQRIALRLLELKMLPNRGSSYRKLLLALPFVMALRSRGKKNDNR